MAKRLRDLDSFEGDVGRDEKKGCLEDDAALLNEGFQIREDQLSYDHPNREAMESHRQQLVGKDGLAKDGNKWADFISGLCDNLIHHVMSFLPVKDAAKTSILSKRWGKLWASMPVIDFDQKYFGQNDSRLANFMSRAILCREREPIYVLRVSLYYVSSYYYIVRQWLQISLASNVKEIHLDFSGGYHSTGDADSDDDLLDYSVDDDADPDADPDASNSIFTMPPTLFTYGSLRVLQLTKCSITHKGPMAFENLECLVLRDVNSSQELIHQMLSAAASTLEKLELTRISGLERLELSAPKLISMKLECCRYLNELLIDAPELQHFECALSKMTKVMSLHFPVLVKAKLSLWFSFHNCVLVLLNHLGHVTDLTLRSERFEDMIISESGMESFRMPNVRRLEMICGMGDDIANSSIFRFLEAFDHMESLCLSIVPCSREEVQWTHRGHHGTKKLQKLKNTSIRWSNLKELKIRGFEGNVMQIKLLNFLLDHGEALEKIDIRTYTPSSLTHGEIHARLMDRRRSQHLKICYT